MSAPAGTARLEQDGGAAAASEQFFRSPQFLEAEGVTHTLIVELGDEQLQDPGDRPRARRRRRRPRRDLALLLPGRRGERRSDRSRRRRLVRRRPRLALHPRPARRAAGAAGRRRPLGRARLRSGAEAQVADERPPADPQERGRRLRDHAARPGRRRAPSSAPSSTPSTRRRWTTSTRPSATASSPPTSTSSSPRRRPSSSSSPARRATRPPPRSPRSATASSTTTSRERRAPTARRRPSKNLIVAVTDRADELGLPMNLGGGVHPGDGLEEFKRGFANTELPFRTHEIVCDLGLYARAHRGPRRRRLLPALPIADAGGVGRCVAQSSPQRPRSSPGSALAPPADAGVRKAPEVHGPTRVVPRRLRSGPRLLHRPRDPRVQLQRLRAAEEGRGSQSTTTSATGCRSGPSR